MSLVTDFNPKLKDLEVAGLAASFFRGAEAEIGGYRSGIMNVGV
jgi:hypothetical protein